MAGRPVRSAAGHLASPVLGSPLWWSRLWRAADDPETACPQQLFYPATQLRIDGNGAFAIKQDIPTIGQLKAQTQRFVPRVTADDFAKRGKDIGAVHIS